MLLAIPTEDREIYRKRYAVNNELLQQDNRINSIIKNNTYSGKINFEKIKQQLFESRNRVRGEEYVAVGLELNRQLEERKDKKDR